MSLVNFPHVFAKFCFEVYCYFPLTVTKAAAPDLVVLSQRIKDVVYVLADFRNRREENR